jgi:hypothetical protein
MVMNTKSRHFAKLWRDLEAIIAEAPSTDTVFNQYRDCNRLVDLPDAAAIRRENLRRYMAGAMKTAAFLVVGEAAGPWECRFSGVPFTGERQLLDPSFPLRGRRSSRPVPACPTRTDPPFMSRSALIFWNVMRPFHNRFLLWNAFPLHSHKPQDVLSVRNPTQKEVSQFAKALRLIKAYLDPTHMVALGRVAFEAVEAIGEAPIYVRHPSQGGKQAFTEGVQGLFKSKGS